jgi:nitrogen fixation protein NifU and related proteins
MYSPQLLDHFQHPRNVGELPPPALTVEVTNPACGDILRLSAAFTPLSIVSEVGYKVRGCTASIAAGSALTELMRGRSIQELRQIQAAAIEEAIGGLASASRHAAVLCADALQRLVQAYGR